MSDLFEKFAKMAKEEFGCTVVKSKEQRVSTFESLFGIDVKKIALQELPYDVLLEQIDYYEARPTYTSEICDLKISKHFSNNFDIETYTLNLAA